MWDLEQSVDKLIDWVKTEYSISTREAIRLIREYLDKID